MPDLPGRAEAGLERAFFAEMSVLPSMFGTTQFWANLALTETVPSTMNVQVLLRQQAMQVLVAVQAPDQPAKAEPFEAWAFRVTEFP